MTPAQALASAAAQVDPSAAATAPTEAPLDDPWSRPEPPRRGQAPGPTEPPPPPQAESDDPWSRPEPPTSRFASQLQEGAAGSAAKDSGHY